MSALAGDTNYLAPRQTSNRRQSADSACVRNAAGMAMAGKNRIMIYGPKTDGTYVIEFKTAAGEALAISVPEPS
jgi:hypothetical protein